ncbi:MAG: hypothetical protein ABIT58_11315 [Ferruginibacter sp.]
MKNIFIVIFTVLLTNTISVSAQIRSNRDLLGKWHGNDRGENLDLEFFADSKVMITAQGGRLPLATYTADFMKMPIEVVLTATDHGQKMVVKGELTFIDHETFKLVYFGDNKRRDAFAEGRSIVMKKTK